MPDVDLLLGIEDFKMINIKDYVLDLSKSKKIDDDLPLLFFAYENFEEEISLEPYHLLLTLLPCYLLINSILCEEMTREQRIEQLTFIFTLTMSSHNLKGASKISEIIK